MSRATFVSSLSRVSLASRRRVRYLARGRSILEWSIRERRLNRAAVMQRKRSCRGAVWPQSCVRGAAVANSTGASRYHHLSRATTHGATASCRRPMGQEARA
eukprot:4850078-Lingulodinium_polyedra.AAC.1